MLTYNLEQRNDGQAALLLAATGALRPIQERFK